jgi:hypothetical protein
MNILSITPQNVHLRVTVPRASFERFASTHQSEGQACRALRLLWERTYLDAVNALPHSGTAARPSNNSLRFGAPDER